MWTVPGAPDAAHAALAGPAADPGSQDVPAAGLGGGHFGVADVAALGTGLLGGVPGGAAGQGGVIRRMGRRPETGLGVVTPRHLGRVPGVFSTRQA
jgi:hypothetical protein